MTLLRIHDLYLLIVITLIRLAAGDYPLQLRSKIIRSVAFAASRLSWGKRRLVNQALCKALGGRLSRQRLRQIANRGFFSYWDDVFYLSLPNRERANLGQIELSGIEYVKSALQEKKGIIIWESSYLGKRHLAKHVLRKEGFSICQVHGDSHVGGLSNPGKSPSWLNRQVIKPFFEGLEKTFVGEILYLAPLDSVAVSRQMLDRLRRNGILCISGDVGAGHKCISLPFLGHTAPFATGMVSLATISGAPIVSMVCLEKTDGKTHLVIEPIHPPDVGIDREQKQKSIISKYAGRLESYVLGYPDQYHGWHVLSYSSKNSEVMPATEK